MNIYEALAILARIDSPHEQVTQAGAFIMAEVTTLQTDKKRMDWLDATGHFEDFHSFVVQNYRPFKQTPIRQAIDAAKEKIV